MSSNTLQELSEALEAAAYLVGKIRDYARDLPNDNSPHAMTQREFSATATAAALLLESMQDAVFDLMDATNEQEQKSPAA